MFPLTLQGKTLFFLHRKRAAFHHLSSLPLGTPGGSNRPEPGWLRWEELWDHLPQPIGRLEWVDRGEELQPGPRPAAWVTEHRLDLEEDPRVLYRKSLREQLRAAERRGVEITPFETRDLEDFLAYVERTYRHKHGVLPPPASLIRALWQHGHNHFLLALAARKGKRLLSGLWLVVSREEAYAFLQGTHPEAYPLRASALLFDRAIALARDQGYRWFSFGATPSSSPGVRFFKERFGAIPHTYPLWVHQHPVYGGLRRIYKGAQVLRGKREIQP